MKYTPTEGTSGGVLELTRRNLIALLDKVTDPLSARTLSKVVEGGGGVITVVAVEDTDHYADRPPGEVRLPALDDLEARLKRARDELAQMANGHGFRSETDRARLRGKVSGLGLALDYLRSYRQ